MMLVSKKPPLFTGEEANTVMCQDEECKIRL